MGDCAWVTQALQEGCVEKALVLGKSLRRVLSTKKLVVIVGPTISLGLRDALEATFDFVLPLDQGKCQILQEIKLKPDSLAKAFALSFTFFDRCIYLPANSMVLKNCDDLFDLGNNLGAWKDISAAMHHSNERVEEGQTEEPFGNILQFQPCRDGFKKINAYFSSANEERQNNPDSMMVQWMQNQPIQCFMTLQKPYSSVVKLYSDKKFVENDDNLCIVTLTDLPAKMDKLDPEKNGFSKAGLLEQFLYRQWLDIYKNEVKIPTSVVTSELPTSINSPHQNGNAVREPIAIVGMSCRFPSSNSVAEFWNLLIEARDGVRTPPDYRWTKEHSVYQKAETRNTQAGFLNVPVDEFDAKFFGISPKEMIFIDPQHRILHELVWEALEDAGINPLNLSGTQSGVFMGSWRNDYYDILHRSSNMEFYRGYMGNSIGAGAARISHLLGLTGPCVATESGCSAAMVAVHMACRSLQNGESNMAFACGVNMLLHPFTPDIMPMVTAPDGHCKSFDANADGFGRAEGAGVLILKRLSEAVKDGDSIWGVIKGTAIAQEGMSKSMGTPTVQCEAQAMRTALRDANVHPSQVSYVETHGTGTTVGDPMEVAAIGRVYSEGRQEPLVIGSVKTNVGHTESCSGITGIMKVILSMKNQVIPQHRNFKELNPNINLEAIPARLPLEPIHWRKTEGKLRTAGVSSFGITGTDGHVIVQEPLDYSNQRIILNGFERPMHLMTVSARTEEALDSLLERYKHALSGEHSENAFANMAYTANVGKAHFNWRAAVIAKDVTAAAADVDSSKLLRGETAAEDTTGKVCFLFTGQGSQYHGMAKELYNTNPVFKMHFDYCEEILNKKHKISIAKTFWGKENEEVSRTLYSQTGIFVVEYCLMKLWESWGVTPDYVLGHSLGEFCAAVCAGILTFEEALTLVAERSRLIDGLPQGKMLVIKADKSSVDTLLKKFVNEKTDPDFWLDFAAVNSSDQTVLAGDADKVLEFSEWLKEKNVKSAVLQSTHAFHSRHMDPMLKEYKATAQKIFANKEISELSCTYLSGMLGKIVDVSSDPINWPDYWVQHTREKVSFMNASKAVYNDGGCRIFLEVGPHPVLTAFTMMNNEGKSMLCLPSLRRNENDWKTMLTTLGKLFVNGSVEIDWKRFDQFYDRKKVGQLLPTYPFQGVKYWPNITSSTGVQIHPLLGSNIPNPTNSKIYQNNLSLQNVEYLKDHVIGSMVVFPGAGYMETLLMAGHAALDGTNNEFRLPRKPIQLENFRIEAPLGLEEGVGCLCQTVVDYSTPSADTESAGGLRVKIYHEMKESEETSTKWVSHASGSFSPYNPGSGLTEKVNVEDRTTYLETMERLKTKGKEENASKEFYDKVADVGLKFGPAFRTLSKVWRDGEKGQEFLAEVNVPNDASSYLVHPTLIDAMIQAAVFHGERNKKIEKKLQVPIGCEKFVWFKPLTTESSKTEQPEENSDEETSEQNVCYIYSNGDSKTIVLLNQDGSPVAALVKVAAIETNAKSIQALLETQVKSIPDIYKMNWKPSLGPLQQRMNMKMGTDLVDTAKQQGRDQSDFSESTVQRRRNLDLVVSHYVTRAFLNLGWNPKVNDIVDIQKIVTELGIKQHHKQLMRRFLLILEAEGILSETEASTEENKQWTVKMLPKSTTEISKECETIVEKYASDINIDASEFMLVRNVGDKLDKILTGTESALRILFPDDESQPNVAKFYDCMFKRSKQILSTNCLKSLQSYRAAYDKNNLPTPIVRVLEVGAGTGSVTQCFLDALEGANLKYEYHFTDISAAFFTAAEKRFEKYRKNMKFLKLNIEEDPTSQGFPPKYYDLVMGAQVIHATRDIKETFINIRSLMKENGNFVLNESLGGFRVLDMIFGLLDGFWRYTDFDLRPYHPMLTADQWEMVGKQMGFSNFSFAHDYELAFIAYRNDEKEFRYEALSEHMSSDMRKIHNDSRVAWLVFYTDDEENYVQQLSKQLEYIGRKKIILVKHSANLDQNLTGTDTPLQNKYEVRPTEKEDMENLFAVLKRSSFKDDPNGFSSIEGVIVTWGLCGKGRDQAEVAKPFLNLVQNILKLDKKAIPAIVVLTAGQYALGDVLCENPTSSTLLGMSRCIANEHSEVRIKGIDMNPAEIISNMEEVVQEIFTRFNEEDGQFYAIRGHERLIPKIHPEKIHSKSGTLSLPQSTDRYQLIHPKSKAIQDLEFGDLDLFTLKPNEIEVKVKCSALNFKDILNILKPTEEFKDSNGVGFDFAGVVSAVGEGVTQRKVGDAVFGINIMGNALPSHIKLPEDAAVPVPESCTFTEAACFPAVFSTAYYCLVNVANVKRGETLLIHTASGGVGLLTIQLAKYFGLNIICTAGNERKRAFLRSLGVQHVFHSRNTNYGKQILEATNGRGIDIVLNSLTGPGFKEATLGACAKGARFVEMSKLNIWSEEEVAERRSDVNYTIIDLTKLDEDTSRKLLQDSRALIENGVVKPIPYTRYDAQDIRDALTYLQKAQHIGKVVVTMPEPKPGSMELSQLYTPVYNERSTYLITGGLGGVGMEVCKYMVNQGAKNIVLVGRSPPNEKSLEVINKLKSEQGANIIALQADVGEWDQCQELFRQIQANNLPPVKGVMHAAGTIADALIENQKWEDFQATYQAKIKGTWNLHELTKDTILEHFVLFSSVTAPFGSPGQANHVSACTFEDTMAHYRISHGLPATTINWGQFGQIGVAAEADVIAIRPFSPQQAINALDLIIRQNRNHYIVASFEKGLATVVKYLPYSKRIIDPQVFKMTDSNQTSKKSLQLSSTQFWEEYNECKDEREGKVDVIRRYTKVLLRHVLRLDADEPIDENTDLQDMGVDSLMMLELKNHLQEVLGDRVTITQSAMKDCNTVNLLADRLVQIIEEEGEFATVEPPTMDEVQKLVAEDCKLPENIRAQVPGTEKKPSEIRVLLMTGVSGVLGSHMLREILDECSQLQKVYCLVRTRGSESAEERLKTILERKCVMSYMKNFDKVKCIPGNFIEERLGMSEGDYEQLVGEVDAVLHCGAKVNHVEYYRNVSGGRSDARSVNVGGLLKVLDFCATNRTKHLFNASTLLAVHDVDEDCTLSENWPDVNSLCVPHNRGYQISKYVGDLLLREATLERGLPCKSFRFAELRGSRVTGGSLIESSHFMKSFLFFIREGIMPELPIASNFLPIDLASRITARIITNDSAPNGVYNVSHPEPQLAQECVPKLAKDLGRNVDIIDSNEYRKRVLEAGPVEGDSNTAEKQALLTEFQELYKDEEGMNALLGGSTPSLRKYFESTADFWKSKKLPLFVPELYDSIESSYEITKTDFLVAKQEGILEKIGL